MKLKIPHKVRAALYVITGTGTPIVMYLFALGLVDKSFLMLWAGEVTFVTVMARFNVQKPEE